MYGIKMAINLSFALKLSSLSNYMPIGRSFFSPLVNDKKSKSYKFKNHILQEIDN